MLIRNGASPAPERREGRVRLTVRDPRFETLLAGRDLGEDDIDHLRHWGQALLRARDAWADTNRGGRRYSDSETARHQNSLVRRGRDGAR